MNEKLIITKLLKIAANQQKIMQRLAQLQQQDPNITYLKRAVQVTAANTGFNATQVDVIASPGTDGTKSPASNIITEPGYTVKLAGAPVRNEVREKFIRQLKAMIAAQKPDQPQLANLSVIFIG
jgi:Fic family protein